MMQTTKDFQLISVERLIPYVNNARTHSKEQILKLRSSLREFGFINPILIDRNYNVLAGHGRLMAAKEEGISEVPCVYVDHLTEAQKKAYVLADNRMALDAGWDEELLSVEMSELQELGFDLELTGFDEKEIADLFATDDEAKEDDFDVDKASELPPFVESNDIWLLGRHRLMCGDSTKAEDVQKLMDGKKANLCITDPPYGIAIGTGAAYQNAKTDRTIMNDNLPDDEFIDFLVKAFCNMKNSLIPGGVFYIWYASSKSLVFLKALEQAELTMRQNLIWEKDRFTLGRQDYQWSFEPCIYSWAEGAAHKFFNDRKQSTVLHFDRPNASKLHSTMKPLPLIGYQMKNSSQENGIVLDLFGGSGTTLIASEQLNRICYMNELDPKYASAIVRRYVALKGGSNSDVFVLRNGEKLPCSAVHDFTAEELDITDGSVDDVQRSDRNP